MIKLKNILTQNTTEITNDYHTVLYAISWINLYAKNKFEFKNIANTFIDFKNATISLESIVEIWQADGYVRIQTKSASVTLYEFETINITIL